MKVIVIIGCIAAALIFIALGMAIAEMYNRRTWECYIRGMETGEGLRDWKNGKCREAETWNGSRAKYGKGR